MPWNHFEKLIILAPLQIQILKMLLSSVDYIFELLQNTFGFHLYHYSLKCHALYILIFEGIYSTIPRN